MTGPGPDAPDAPGVPDAPDAPVRLEELLLPEERQLLGESARELRCPLGVLDRDGRLVFDFGLGAAPPAVQQARPEAEPVLCHTPGGAYLCAAFFHDGDRLALIVAGPAGQGPVAGPVDAPEGPAGPAPAPGSLPIPRHLCRVAEALLVSGVRRVLSSRVHLASVEDAYCELQLKNQRLEQAIQRMQELDRIKSNFLATVSHELRTPLTSVIGYSEMLMEGLAGPLNDEQREYLRTVMDKGEQLLGLITGILDISRIESAGVQLFPGPVDLRELCAEVVTTVTPQARRKRLALVTGVPAGLPLVLGDRDKLRQVLLNLVSNAVKFTPEAGQVSVSATQHGEQVEVSVADSGIGIPADLYEKVFDPFFQVDNSSTREYEGTGLGLSIVRKFVEAHGGRVWVEGGSGDKHPGVVFHFTLPVCRP